MTHLKRLGIPKNWPIDKKSKVFAVNPLSKKGISLLTILRDMLKICKDRREVKKAIHKKLILINNKPVKDEKIGLALFDTLSIVKSGISYRLTLSDIGKFKMEEIDKSKTNNKIAKIINKRILKGKKIQLNLSDGSNFICDLNCNVNDSVLIDLENKKIIKCIPFEKNRKVLIFAGKHSGENGFIEEINKENKTSIINTGKEKLKVLIKQMMVIE